MGKSPVRFRKPLKFVPGVEKAVKELPSDVQDVFGKALMAAQYGDPVPGARPFGEGVPRDVLKLVEDDDGETYRAAFVVAFEGLVYLLDVFQKKSKSGKATPKADIDRVTARYQAAALDYAANKAEYLRATAAAKAAATAKAAQSAVPRAVRSRRGKKS
ncbi:MAG: type II toxin-antitoxin system RelE/ParE family toxin [Gemmatimonadaceae bacterium]|nr:type II toxin-antitoxin system RelE/ParE family toxin [Gemmatimonadaceae bacterium]